jgi:hypothetical protein
MCCRRGKRRRAAAQTQGVSTIVAGGTEASPTNENGRTDLPRRRASNVRVYVMKEGAPGDAASPRTDDDDMVSPQSTIHHDDIRVDMVDGNSNGAQGLNATQLAKLGSFKKPHHMMAFDVCSVDVGSWSEMSLMSEFEDEEGDPLPRGQSLQAVNSTRNSMVFSPIDASSAQAQDRQPTDAGIAAGDEPSPQRATAIEVDTQQLDYVMSRIFSSTYHTPAMCLLNMSAREDPTMLASRRLTNSVMVSEKFSTLVFKQKRTTANEVLIWLLSHQEGAYSSEGATRGPMALCPLLSDDDLIFFADQRRILRRLLMKPQPKGTAKDANDVDSDFDDTDPDYNPDEDLHQRTLEEGFCQVLLPAQAMGRGGTGVPTVATLYISTIASQTLPIEMQKIALRETPLLSVVSVVGTRPLNHPSIDLVRNELGSFPQSRVVVHEEISGSVFQPNFGPCFIRGTHFTGNIFTKTMTDPQPDPRIQPYFEGKNRKFEIQIQGRITPPPGVDMSRGTICFCIMVEDRLSGPGGKPLSFMQNTMVKGIVGAFKVIGRGGLQVMRGDENPEAFPHMGIPLLTFLDRLSLRADNRSTSPLMRPVDPKDGEEYRAPKPSPALALGVAMLPETPELAHMQKLHAKEAKKHGKAKEEHNPFDTRTTSYTMSFHSQYMDFENWKLCKLTGFNNVGLHTYFGDQHLVVGVGFLPEGVPMKEIRTRGSFLLKLRIMHESNRAAAEAATDDHEPTA